MLGISRNRIKQQILLGFKFVIGRTLKAHTHRPIFRGFLAELAVELDEFKNYIFTEETILTVLPGPKGNNYSEQGVCGGCDIVMTLNGLHHFHVLMWLCDWGLHEGTNCLIGHLIGQVVACLGKPSGPRIPRVASVLVAAVSWVGTQMDPSLVPFSLFLSQSSISLSSPKYICLPPNREKGEALSVWERQGFWFIGSNSALLYSSAVHSCLWMATHNQVTQMTFPVYN